VILIPLVVRLFKDPPPGWRPKVGSGHGRSQSRQQNRLHAVGSRQNVALLAVVAAALAEFLAGIT